MCDEHGVCLGLVYSNEQVSKFILLFQPASYLILFHYRMLHYTLLFSYIYIIPYNKCIVLYTISYFTILYYITLCYTKLSYTLYNTIYYTILYYMHIVLYYRVYGRRWWRGGVYTGPGPEGTFGARVTLPVCISYTLFLE